MESSDGSHSSAAGFTPSSVTGGFTEVVLQRQAEAGTVGDPEPVEQTGVAVSDTAPAQTVEPALPSGRNLDELAERLYEPLSARLRAELWLDRERSGLMVDLRQ